ncbi:MAG TPA: glycine oxidase ThiO [Hyphomicrobiales bacterium]|nr:glycine oxidase ThiO [Hyphomicrobiales bacterium]
MHVGIGGAGLVGRLLAWRLLRAGHAVSLFDQDQGNGQQAAGFIAAAMLAPYSEAASVGSEILEPGLKAIRLWARWLEELRDDSGRQVPWQRRGTLVVAHQADQVELHWFRQRLLVLGASASGAVRWLDRTALRQQEPALDAFDAAVHLPREACLDNRALFAALAVAIDRLGGRWRVGERITHVEAQRIVTEAGTHHVDMALDCRGFGAKAQLEGLRGVRGEILWLRAPEVQLSRPVRLLHPRYQIYLAPRPQQRYVIGATELESESLAPVTVRSHLELLSALYTLHPGFAEAQVLEARSHCRPAFMNNLPQIALAPGVMRVNGLYRHGYLLGPLLVQSALALLRGEPALAPVSVVQERKVPSAMSAAQERTVPTAIGLM